MIQLSHHARTQGAEKGFTVNQMLDAANRPSITYPSRNHRGQTRNIRDGVVAVVAGNIVVSVYANVVETDQRPDQTDASAERHFTDRRKRDAKKNARRERDRAFTAAQKTKKG